MTSSIRDCLAITASGEDRVGLVEQLTDRISASGCNIEQSRMGVLGGQFALIMLLTGEHGALAHLAGQLGPLGGELGLAIIHKWTREREPAGRTMPYQVEVVALDHPGIVHGLAGFFARHSINIEALETDTYAAPHTGTAMFAVHMMLGVPASTPVAALREAFFAYCDDLNLDASLEAAR